MDGEPMVNAAEVQDVRVTSTPYPGRCRYRLDIGCKTPDRMEFATSCNDETPPGKISCCNFLLYYSYWFLSLSIREFLVVFWLIFSSFNKDQVRFWFSLCQVRIKFGFNLCNVWISSGFNLGYVWINFGFNLCYVWTRFGFHFRFGSA